MFPGQVSTDSGTIFRWGVESILVFWVDIHLNMPLLTSLLPLMMQSTRCEREEHWGHRGMK
eukprot:186416-Pelagomonas_calceolata.AAC.1